VKIYIDNVVIASILVDKYVKYLFIVFNKFLIINLKLESLKIFIRFLSVQLLS
ncbi:hypothetical protein P170DRAFT_319341, partial [Aspergillus steynii IBT 23096]